VVVVLLAGVAGVLWAASLALTGPAAVLVSAIALFYSMLFVVSAYALWRCHALEEPATWNVPRRLLILAPHEDDCVIAAGGIGARNRRLGGATRIVYLVPDEQPGMAERRRDEARAAWQEAGLDAGELRFLDLLRGCASATLRSCGQRQPCCERSSTSSNRACSSCRCSRAAISSMT